VSGEISESASHISGLATENSHATEEAAEACKHLSALATDLDRIIRQFRMDDGSGRRVQDAHRVSGRSAA
jgi:methyl-accepting chemotaxis protein